MRISRFAASAVMIALLSVGCIAPKGATLQEKRDYALSMRDKSLKTLYAKEPGAKSVVEQSPGYAVFDQFGFGLLFMGNANGYAPVTDNKTKQVTYMKTFQITPGFGIGGKSYRTIVVFGDNEAMKAFLDNPWESGAEAEAAFKFGETGGSLCSAGSFNGKLKVYQFTDGGIMLRADIPIQKYWQDDELNGVAKK